MLLNGREKLFIIRVMQCDALRFDQIENSDWQLIDSPVIILKIVYRVKTLNWKLEIQLNISTENTLRQFAILNPIVRLLLLLFGYSTSIWNINVLMILSRWMENQFRYVYASNVWCLSMECWKQKNKSHTEREKNWTRIVRRSKRIKSSR